jgi:3-oxosteroid 1-dehydrogenase
VDSAAADGPAADRLPTECFDVVVVGSGSGAMVAALRAADLGLSVVVLEKEHQYGGTSAISAGFMWVPNHGLAEDGDSRDKGLTYLRAISPKAREERLVAYVDNGPAMLRFLIGKGLKLEPLAGYPDYFPDAPGAHPGRGVIPRAFDGRKLGRHFFTLREQTIKFKLFTRYSVEVPEGGQIGMRAPGWQRTFARILWNYWSDIGWRLKTKRDRRLTLGNALLGALRHALDRYRVEVRLGHALVGLVRDDGRVTAVEVEHHGVLKRIAARHGVIIGAGGFEQNQAMRDQYFEFPTDKRTSATPRDANTGGATLAAMKIGAATELMDQAWWNPTLVMPSRDAVNIEITDPVTYDFSRPHSLCVNRKGVRFVNEGCPYDEFGQAMIADQRKSDANIPCWIVFDSQYRAKFACGMLWPSIVLPDWRVPPNWWDTYFYRADTIEELAGKIEIDPAALAASVAKMNGYAQTGIDPEFGRGGNKYDLYSGDPNLKPNPSLGTIDKPPYYAARIELGDIGTKGGLKADDYGRVLDVNDAPIPGLYAVGNASGSAFGNRYPGAGGTVGPSATYGFIAANDIHRRASAESQTEAVVAAR